MRKACGNVKITTDIRHLYALYSHGRRPQTTGMKTYKDETVQEGQSMDRTSLR